MRKMTKSEAKSTMAGWVRICQYLGGGWWYCVTYY
jgi:hypothetical protein